MRLSLRLRIFLLFAALASASIAALVAGLFFGFHKEGTSSSLDALIIGGTVAGFIIAGLATWMWLLFDDNIAKPIERLAAALRTRTHASVTNPLDLAPTQYLGDLGPAAQDLILALNEARSALAATASKQTGNLVYEKALLATLLSDISTGVLMCSASHQLVFYNVKAASLMGGLDADPTPGLNRSLFEYLHPDPIQAAYERLKSTRDPDAASDILCATQAAGTTLLARMRLLPNHEQETTPDGYMLTLHNNAALATASISQALVYDFELLFKSRDTQLHDTHLEDLTYVVFDTETTGLYADQGDKIIQIAAVRIVNGRRVHKEIFNTLVNPERAIPLSSTQIHGITDNMCTAAPTIDVVARKFHQFVKGAVLVAHNAPFDMSFLRQQEQAIGCRFDNPILDTVLLSAVVFGQSENHSLDALSRRLGIMITEEDRHTAIGDATATADVFLQLVPALKAQGLKTFGDVLGEVRKQRRLLKDLNKRQGGAATGMSVYY